MADQPLTPPQQNNQGQPPPQTAPQLSGAAAGTLPSFNLSPNQPAAPGTPGYAPPPDPTASPFSQWRDRMGQTNFSLAPNQPADPLARGPTPWDRMVDFFSRQDPSKPNIDQRADTASFYGRPDVQNVVMGSKPVYDAATADPEGMRSKLEPLLAAAAGAGPVTHNGKTTQDQAGLAAKMQATGMNENVVGPFHEPHQYTEEEFVNATRGISWNQLGRLMQLQHYVPPQQQMTMGYISDLAKDADEARKTLQSYQDQNLAPGKIKDQQELFNKKYNMYMNERARLVSPSTYALPNMQDFTEGQNQ